MDARVAMEPSCEPYYHKSDNLKRQAPQKYGRVFEKDYGDSELAVCNTKTFASLSLGNILAEPCFPHMAFYIALSLARCEEAEGVVEPRPNHLPCRTCCGRDSVGVARRA
jgi:hypothetical protein